MWRFKRYYPFEYFKCLYFYIMKGVYVYGGITWHVDNMLCVACYVLCVIYCVLGVESRERERKKELFILLYAVCVR